MRSSICVLCRYKDAGTWQCQLDTRFVLKKKKKNKKQKQKQKKKKKQFSM